MTPPKRMMKRVTMREGRSMDKGGIRGWGGACCAEKGFGGRRKAVGGRRAGRIGDWKLENRIAEGGRKGGGGEDTVDRGGSMTPREFRESRKCPFGTKFTV